jgi:tetratricopeptide (TPR) repeat protein
MAIADANLHALDRAAASLRQDIDASPDRVLALTVAMVTEVFGDETPAVERTTEAAVLVNCCANIIDAADRIDDVDGLVLGERWNELAVASGQLDGTPWESLAVYNLANARIAIVDNHVGTSWRASKTKDRPMAVVRARWHERERLAKARREYKGAAVDAEDGRAEGMRLCNLANTLDSSGRWVEAYDAYVRALEADPTNGNAAGNAAVLIGRAVGRGWDFEGHLCSLHDRYLRIAHEHRARTVEIAGEATAQKYDAMALLGSTEPDRNAGNPGDEYQTWISRHRLALVAALEGLGGSGSRWDTILLSTVNDDGNASDAPHIFRILNVLKGDYLTARRIAFDATRMLEETNEGRNQHPSDPGVYINTMDDAVYGEPVSMLVLAHRAALDVLDKTAVAVNEHLGVGDPPRDVAFRRFWFEDKKRNHLRATLMAHPEVAFSCLAMAELAIDMLPGGLYAHAQEVRNAGTHRFVLVTGANAHIKVTETMNTQTVAAMTRSTIEALTVARAAYLYLVAMLESYERAKASSAPRIPLLLPTQD